MEREHPAKEAFSRAPGQEPFYRAGGCRDQASAPSSRGCERCQSMPAAPATTSRIASAPRIRSGNGKESGLPGFSLSSAPPIPPLFFGGVVCTGTTSTVVVVVVVPFVVTVSVVVVVVEVE